MLSITGISQVIASIIYILNNQETRDEIYKVNLCVFTGSKDTSTGKTIKRISLSPAPYHLNTIHGTGKVYVFSNAMDCLAEKPKSIGRDETARR